MPLNSGAFAEPEKTFPRSFGKIALLKQFPYLLPCIISTLVILSGMLAGLLFLKEVKTQTMKCYSNINHDRYLSSLLDQSPSARTQKGGRLLLLRRCQRGDTRSKTAQCLGNRLRTRSLFRASNLLRLERLEWCSVSRFHALCVHAN